jgi:predicted nucleotidyltransferase
MGTWEDDVAVMRAFIRKTRAKEQRALAERLKQARTDAARIIAYIAEHYRPSRIYQWGSLLHPEQFQRISDIDIAVEGIEDCKVFDRLVGECTRMTDLPLDIVRLEDVHPRYRSDIVQHGVASYER